MHHRWPWQFNHIDNALKWAASLETALIGCRCSALMKEAKGDGTSLKSDVTVKRIETNAMVSEHTLNVCSNPNSLFCPSLGVKAPPLIGQITTWIDIYSVHWMSQCNWGTGGDILANYTEIFKQIYTLHFTEYTPPWIWDFTVFGLNKIPEARVQ